MSQNQEALLKAATEMARVHVPKEQLAAQVIVHTPTQVFSLECKPSNGTDEQTQRILIVNFIRQLIEARRLLGVVLISEAWAAPVANPVITQVLPPSRDPDRKEIFIARAYDPDGRAQQVAYEIKDRQIAEPIDMGDTSWCWLDQAFLP